MASGLSPDPVSQRVIAVAYSGGRDSTALLHACAVAARNESALRVVALHVHHGLSAQADAWQAHAQTTCDEWARAGLPVSLMVFLLVPEQATQQHLEILSELAEFLSDKTNREALMSADSAGAVLQLVQTWEPARRSLA